MRIESNKYATLRNVLLTGSAASALSFGLAPVALAQPAAAPVEKVTVTGTRIPQKNLQTTSPVTQVTAADIDTQGVTRVEDLTNELPQVFAAQNSTVANGASGAATVNLRGLGAKRTLVLINGRRMPYGTPDTSAADINMIPGQLVDRVEVLTGGASAVYGSDALAGVVNFIMRKDFEGAQIDAQYGFYSHHNDFDGPGYVRQVIAGRAATNPREFRLPEDDVNDGVSKTITGLIGVSSADGGGNITAYINYRTNDQILQRDRDFSACSFGAAQSTAAVVGVPAGERHVTCGGSGTSAGGLFTDFVTTFALTIDQTTGLARNFSNATDQYNFGPLNHFQRPDETYTMGAFMHYQLDEQVEAYMDLMFSDYETAAQIAPAGAFFDTSTINCGNPFLSAGAFSAAQLTSVGCTPAAITANTSVPFYIGRRNVEGGGRQSQRGFETYRMSGGFRGEALPGVDYDLALQYSRVRVNQSEANYFTIAKIKNALNVVDTDPGPGVTATCQSVIDGSDPACVPYNVFQLGGVTQAALDYLQTPGTRTSSLKQSIGTFTLNADLGTWGVKSPFAESPVQMVLGTEFRRDQVDALPDDVLATGQLSGSGGPTIGLNGSTDVSEYFGELQIPLMEDQDFAKQVTLEFAYRYSSYDSSITTDTWKIGADWAPTEDIRFRASKQRAVRAANIVELFSAQGNNLFDMTGDPCGLGGAGTAAACVGVNPWQVTALQFGTNTLNSPAGQYNQLAGGNPTLTPEVGDTKTFGFVFTPTFMKDFNLSVDYFDIDIQNAVGQFLPADRVTACFLGGDLSSCTFIRRNPANGTLWVGSGQVTATNTNVGGFSTSGVDVNVQYKFDLDDVGLDGAGGLSFALIGTWLDELITNPGTPGTVQYDCAGFYGNSCGTPNPEWRHRLRGTWSTAWDADLSVTWRHYGSVDRAAATCPTLGCSVDALQGGLPRLDAQFEAENYFDVAGTIGLPLNSRLRFGINNIMDNDPPLSYATGTTGNGNTYPQTYESRGRFMFMGISVDM
ncbi:MAG: TonB-dependent receptor [Micropepsaceae bacterium]